MSTLLEVQNLKLYLRKPMQERGEIAPLFQIPFFSVNRGERIALIGKSGIGKTLFLRSLCLLEPNVQGHLLWSGQKVRQDQVPRYRAQVIYMGQRTQLPDGTVRNAFETTFRYVSHRHKQWNIKSTLSALDFFGKSRKLIDQSIEILSGGEKQLVHLLRTLALQPELLCLDEPTSALDQNTQLNYEEYIRTHFSGAWIWVTHQPEQANRIGSSICEMTSRGITSRNFCFPEAQKRSGNPLSQVSASILSQ